MIRIKNPTLARLPSEYQEIEYIETTGTQYINTGVVNSSTIYIEHVASFANATSALSGAEYDSNSRFRWGLTAANYLYIGYGTASRDINVSNISIDRYFTFKVGKGIQEVVDVASYANTSNLTNYCTEPIHLMARRLYGTSDKTDNMGKQRTKSCKIYDNNVLIRDFVPCYRKSDNVPGLYDTVNNVFYTNAGSGTFLMGNEVGKRDLNINPIIVDTPLLRRYVKDKLVYGEAPKQGRFVAVGANGKSYYSEDGETWAAMSGLASSTYYGVAYGSNRYVAAGVGMPYYSEDGITWAIGSGASTSYAYLGACFGKNRFVIVSKSGYSYYSTSGKSWTKMTGLGSSTTINAVTYGNDRFVCVGASGKSYYSTGGTAWTTMSGLSGNFYGVTYGNDRFVCVGASGKSYYSTNGTSWTAMSGLSSTYTYNAVTYGNGMFVTAGSGGKAYYSTNGTNWTAGNNNVSNCYGITFGNGRFIAVCSSGKSYYSLDGINWVEMTGLASATYRGVCYGEI